MNEALATRDYLTKKRTSIKEEIDRLVVGLKHVDWVLENLVHTDDEISDDSVIGLASPVDDITSDEMAGRSIKECLHFMAGRNGGEITSEEARKKLVSVGILEDDRTSNSRVWEAFNRSPLFEKIERGRYRLLDEDEDDDEDDENGGENPDDILVGQIQTDME